MKPTLRPTLAVALLALSPLSAARADPFLVVPGHSLGRVSLGLNGDRALSAPPTASDDSITGELDRVWRSQEGVATLFIHTRRKDMEGSPRPRVTEIRATSPQFHTQNGVAPGSPLFLIRRRFPHGTLLSGDGHFYIAARQGITFEFARPPRPDTPCLAVTVFAPGSARDSRFATEADVRGILKLGN